MTSNIPNKNNIVCRWMEEKKLVVNPDRQVWPCCYLANQGYKFKTTGQYNDENILARSNEDVSHPVMQEYYRNEDQLNLSKNPLNKVLEHDWFTKTLPESWDTDNPHRLCMIMCSRFMED